MKYPFTPEILDALPEELAELFRGLESDLLEEICSRLKISGQLNEVTIQDIRALRSLGIPLDKIKGLIQERTDTALDRLDKLFDDVVARNQSYFTELIDFAKVTQPEYIVSEKDIAAIREQTAGKFVNLTQSMGFLLTAGGKQTMLPPAKAYQSALDRAEMQILSGGVSYKEAIKQAVKDLADSGIKVVDYESGHTDQVDVAVRRAVMTGIGQICDKYTVQSAEYLGTKDFEISAHIGARDTGTGWQNHKNWQGRVYSEGQGQRYPDIYEVCGLGYVDGLEGANCRHKRYPWVEGVSERTYTDYQLEHIDDGHDCEYQGKHYTAYEATQQQRKIERTIRKLKRERAAYEKAGLTEDAQDVSIRIRRLQAEYKSFSKAAGLPEQTERMKVYSASEKSIANIKSRAIIKSREMSKGMRMPPGNILTKKEIDDILLDADAIGIDRNILRFNVGGQTGFSDEEKTIHIRGDIIPDLESNIARDRMSSRAVLAHEYYGHYMNDPSEYEIGDWRDEYRASRSAAVNAPNLSDEDRAYLMIDAYDRAREAGQVIDYDEEAKRIIYGYKDER